MKWFFAVAFTLTTTPLAAQTGITAAQTRLIGCFGEAFTLVEHVWRIAPTHLDHLADEASRPGASARTEYLAGLVVSALNADQASAFALVRNLDGCMTEATEQPAPDATTAILAAAVRTELDSAIEDVAALIKQVGQRRDVLLRTLGAATSARSLDAPLDAYLSFGERIKDDLLRLRGRADALVAASTPSLK
jgi:hypothetical protein